LWWRQQSGCLLAPAVAILDQIAYAFAQQLYFTPQQIRFASLQIAWRVRNGWERPRQLGGVDVIGAIVAARGGKPAAFDRPEQRRLVDPDRLGGLGKAVSHALRIVAETVSPYQDDDAGARADDPLGHVVSANQRRRHLDESQRAMVAARVATLRTGQRADRVDGSIDLSTAAEMLNVGEATVKRARVVLDEGTPELVDMVDCGELAVLGTAAIAKLPVEEQGPGANDAC
jgi:hypothetical protein